ncbi:MAG: phenylacetate-CoA oxygenase subunit PaaC [Ignavibacteriales bacterium]|nr:phenylacetate-CoA oxygenase subunit PaaC [Ignavibacteriales bacterium]
MSIEVPSNISSKALSRFVLSLADDEFILGHRDSEWTGYGPILEEDIAFSNIAQDEIGHSLVWLTLCEQLGGRSPDAMAFERSWKEFTCCRFVSYPKGDFAYTVVRQYLFDAAEQVRLQSLAQSSFKPLKEIAEKLIREESYHLLHSQSLVERLGDATEESHRRMQAALDEAFSQSLGMFETLQDEEGLIQAGVFPGNDVLRNQWLHSIVPMLKAATLTLPVKSEHDIYRILCSSDDGGRRGAQTEHLQQLVSDLRQVYDLAPQSKW